MRISNKAYDILKFIVTIVLPALTTAWLELSTIWNLPYGKPIGATIGVITMFLGALIGVSSAQYNKEKENDNEQQ